MPGETTLTTEAVVPTFRDAVALTLTLEGCLGARSGFGSLLKVGFEAGGARDYWNDRDALEEELAAREPLSLQANFHARHGYTSVSGIPTAGAVQVHVYLNGEDEALVRAARDRVIVESRRVGTPLEPGQLWTGGGVPAAPPTAAAAAPVVRGATAAPVPSPVQRANFWAARPFWLATSSATVGGLAVLAIWAGAPAVWRALVNQPWLPYAATALGSLFLGGLGMWLIQRYRRRH